MAGSSEDTTTSANSPLCKAAETEYASMGCPKNDRTFFPGSRFDPPRAGMMAINLLLKCHPLLLGGRSQCSQCNLQRQFRFSQTPVGRFPFVHTGKKLLHFGYVHLIALKLVIDNFSGTAGPEDSDLILRVLPFQSRLVSG